MIVFGFFNEAEVDFRYSIVGGAINNQRSAFIDGGDFVVFQGQTIPEPSLGLFRGLFALCVACFRRRARYS